MRTPVVINTINLDFNFVGIDSLPMEVNSNTLSTPILPKFPPKSPKDALGSHNNSEVEASPDTNNNFSIPPILDPKAIPQQGDPFIKEPFIKEPFIELPRLQIN